MMDKPLCPHCGKPVNFTLIQEALIRRPVVFASAANGVTTSGFTEAAVGEGIYQTDCCARFVSIDQIVKAFTSADVEYPACN